MKKRLLMFMCFCLCGAVAFSTGRWLRLDKQQKSEQFADSNGDVTRGTGLDFSTYSEFNTGSTAFPITEFKKFAVIVLSYNNADYCEGNLKSIFDQKYDNYRVIYVNDASTDDTSARVKDYVAKRGMERRITIVDNPVNKGPMANHWLASNMCDDDEIIVIVDGDDQFIGDYVLQRLNHYYNNPDVWMTYGQYIEYPSLNIGVCGPVPTQILRDGNMRKVAWTTSHLRTYYAGLLKRIKIDDLMENGEFLKAAADVATMLPMLDMAREHVAFIPDILYLYNRDNPLAEDIVNRDFQLNSAQAIHDMDPYPGLEHPPYQEGVAL